MPDGTRVNITRIIVRVSRVSFRISVRIRVSVSISLLPLIWYRDNFFSSLLFSYAYVGLPDDHVEKTGLDMRWQMHLGKRRGYPPL